MKKLLLLIGGLLFANEETKYIVKLIKEMENYKITFKKLKKPVRAFINNDIPVIINKKTIKGVSKIQFELEAIVFHKALINNKWVKVGDKIYEYKVIYIGKKEVVLSKNNKKVVLKIESNIIRVEK
jgi:uncharacterized protein YlaI